MESFSLLKFALSLLLFTSCVTKNDRPPSLTILDIEERIPRHTTDRPGWARDIHAAITKLDLEPTVENVCAVVAVIDQESNFHVDPKVANLPNVVRDGLRSKLRSLGPLAEPALKALLAGKSPNSSRTFAERIDHLRTEGDLDRLFRDITSTYRERLPDSLHTIGKVTKFFGGRGLDIDNPVSTAGSMQVKVDFARTLEEFEDLTEAEVRDMLYTRYGGVRVGTARLLGYEARYDNIVFRFADYNAGVYASRNAAFQAVLADLTGQAIEPDGDLVAYNNQGTVVLEKSKTFKAMRTFAKSNDMWELFLRRAAHLEKTADFEDTAIWKEVRSTWRERYNQEPPYARFPSVTIQSPKLQGTRTSTWFARSVERRYNICKSRHNASV
jgi:hypothetical protein